MILTHISCNFFFFRNYTVLLYYKKSAYTNTNMPKVLVKTYKSIQGNNLYKLYAMKINIISIY